MEDHPPGRSPWPADAGASRTGDPEALAASICLDLAGLRSRLLRRPDLLEEGLALHVLLEQLADLLDQLRLSPVEGGEDLVECEAALDRLAALGDQGVAELIEAIFGIQS